MLGKKPKHVYMIFCNTSKGSYWLSQTLTEAGIQNVLMHKEVDEVVSSYCDLADFSNVVLFCIIRNNIAKLSSTQ